MIPQLAIPNHKLKTFCEKKHIKRLLLFGSVLRDDFDEFSDIDILLEFEESYSPSFLTFSAMQRELSEILGRDVDLNTINSLKPIHRNSILQKAFLIYEKND